MPGEYRDDSDLSEEEDNANYGMDEEYNDFAYDDQST